MNDKVGKTAVIVPAHNEEKVIAQTLIAILKIAPAEDIYVVDDGSGDNTREIALKYTSNVLTLTNHGKAHALNFGIKHYNLTTNYEFIFFLDADTKPKEDFLEKIYPHFEADTENELVCVVGRVKGEGVNWITKYRQWEYQISQSIHKKAQMYLKNIVVTPGCATVYRSFIFDKLEYPDGTLTEDMDFTFLMHRNGYNNIGFETNAIVYTQDPQKLKDLIKQLKRWYSGFWQVVKKHNVPWMGQSIDLEAFLLATEGLYNGILVATVLILSIPLLYLNAFSIFKIPLLLDLFVFFLPTLIWSSVVDRDLSRLIYIPHFYLLRVLSSVIFIYGFFKGYVLPEKEYMWNSNRYDLEKEVV